MELSVIIAAFNRERTVAATIASVRACGTDAEIIVVDDGSYDLTALVASNAGAKVVSQANAGPAAARNTGLRHASAPIVAFLDSDDTWKPGVVPECLAALRDHPNIDVLFCETLVGNEREGYGPMSAISGRGRFHELLTESLAPHLYRLHRAQFVPMMIERNQMFLGSTLFRRCALDAGGGFDPALFGGEDYELGLRYSVRFQIAFWAKPLSVYEKHGGGLSANADRMAREFMLATRRFAELPDLTPAERRHAQSRYRQLAFEYGYQAYDRGDFFEARRRFAAAPFSLKATAFRLACSLPAPAVRLLRRVKQGVS